jgi:hypothetical protein
MPINDKRGKFTEPVAGNYFTSLNVLMNFNQDFHLNKILTCFCIRGFTLSKFFRASSSQVNSKPIIFNLRLIYRIVMKNKVRNHMSFRPGPGKRMSSSNHSFHDESVAKLGHHFRQPVLRTEKQNQFVVSQSLSTFNSFTMAVPISKCRERFFYLFPFSTLVCL